MARLIVARPSGPRADVGSSRQPRPKLAVETLGEEAPVHTLQLLRAPPKGRVEGDMVQGVRPVPGLGEVK
eukprot:14535344-Alexandrium_andersonii.AAC.1